MIDVSKHYKDRRVLMGTGIAAAIPIVLRQNNYRSLEKILAKTMKNPLANAIKFGLFG